MPVKFDNCPLCGGKVDDNCTTNYAECWCTECGLMLKAWGKDAGQKLVVNWNKRVLPEVTLKKVNGKLKCQCGKVFAEKANDKFCPNCGKRIAKEGKDGREEK